MKSQTLLLISVMIIILFSCRKNGFITSKDAVVQFSSDTLFFDTVFVSTGSITQQVKIFNGNSQQLHLSDIRLMGGANSYFAMNVDGSPGTEQQNIDIAAGDSLYLFVAVSIHPNTANLPFIIQDSIQVSFNGIEKYIQLQAYGQNAHFLHNQIIEGNVTWDKTLPYVVTGGLQIDTTATLTIPEGCHVYFHADAPLLVDGTLLVSGDHYDSTRVYFQGDRLDNPYNEFPASWPGIYFRPSSTNNSLQYAVIKNANQAIVALSPAPNAQTKLTLLQCIIDNSYDAGILGMNSTIQGSNCLISNCGKNIELSDGGTYQFTNCTAASFSNQLITHSQPVLSLSNYAVTNAGIQTSDLTSSFINCIFWGNYGTVDDEVQTSAQTGATFSANFSHCLWKIKNFPSGVDTLAMLTNADPLFDSTNNFIPYYDFHLKAGSPAIGAGTPTSVTIDLDGKTRAANPPDLGAYSFQ